jgi:hypothetical protein
MLLQISTIGVGHALLRISEQTVPTCSAKISRINVHSYTMWFRQVTKYVIKYDTLIKVLDIDDDMYPIS